MTSITRKTIMFAVCLIVIISMILNEQGNTVLASGKKKFLKGFILGALLGKSHYPVVYSIPSHGGHGSSGHGGYGGW